MTGDFAMRCGRALPPHLAMRGRAWAGLLLGATGSLGVLRTVATPVVFVVASAFPASLIARAFHARRAELLVW